MTFISNRNPQFRSQFAETIFNQKYAHEGCETWAELCRTLVEDVCFGLMDRDDIEQLIVYMTDMKFIPGGRYLYYAGRPAKYFNNCYLLRAEETTENWAMARRSVPAGCEHLRHGDLPGAKPTQIIVFK